MLTKFDDIDKPEADTNDLDGTAKKTVILV